MVPVCSRFTFSPVTLSLPVRCLQLGSRKDTEAQQSHDSHDTSHDSAAENSVQGLRFTVYFTYSQDVEEGHEMNEPAPLNPAWTPEVPLPRAPLARVIAQARFSPILAIRDPRQGRGIPGRTPRDLSESQRGSGSQHRATQRTSPEHSQGLIWRLSDREKDPHWRVSLGVDFVALETSSYDSRDDFLGACVPSFPRSRRGSSPASANRFGLRYIDRLTGEAVESHR